MAFEQHSVSLKMAFGQLNHFRIFLQTRQNNTHFFILDNRLLLSSAKVISQLTSPFYLPVLAFLLVFMFSYLRLLPWEYKGIVIGLVYFFTALLPRTLIFLYVKINGWGHRHLSFREHRYVPYILSILSYSTLLYLMTLLYMPRFTMGLIVGALSIQLTCFLLTPVLKVSTHAASAGSTIGALMVLGLYFNFNPLFWLSIAILYTGVVCTARYILRVHTLAGIGWGVLIGVICGALCILMS